MFLFIFWRGRFHFAPKSKDEVCVRATISAKVLRTPIQCFIHFIHFPGKYTCFHFLAKVSFSPKNSKSLVSYLAKHTQDGLINARCIHGRTPLHLAIREQNNFAVSELVRFLYNLPLTSLLITYLRNLSIHHDRVFFHFRDFSQPFQTFVQVRFYDRFSSFHKFISQLLHTSHPKEK